MVHTASPFPIAAPKNEDELIRPAVDGTIAVMRGCQAAGVKKVVITSSIAAIASDKKTHFTSEDWADYENEKPYEKSKALAEKAAWDFINDLTPGQKFDLVTINPGFIIGPNLNSAHFSSGDIIGKKFMMGELPGIPQLSMPIVDVRNVAEAHV